MFFLPTKNGTTTMLQVYGYPAYESRSYADTRERQLR